MASISSARAAAAPLPPRMDRIDTSAIQVAARSHNGFARTIGLFADDEPRDTTGHLVTTLTSRHAEFLRYARKYADNMADAEDAVQQLYLKLLSQRSILRDRAKAFAWLKIALRNVAVDMRRRRNAERKAECVFGEIVAASASPDSKDRFVACNCLEAALKTPQDDLVARIDLAGDARAEVATELGITEGNLRVRLLRARRALRRKIARRCADCPAYDGSPCVCDDRGTDGGNDLGGLPSINWEQAPARPRKDQEVRLQSQCSLGSSEN